jgi:AcrR family transcriptional regulator
MRILDAAKGCCEHWGFERVTVDDIANEARVSRATLYRLFPGGKDILFEALRVREIDEFFKVLRAEVEGIDDLEELLVRSVVCATRELRADKHLAIMLASEPGETLSQLTVAGLPRITRVASGYLVPLALPFLDRATAQLLVDVLARLTISYFLAPSDDVDLGDEASARTFLRPFIPVSVHHTAPQTSGVEAP